MQLGYARKDIEQEAWRAFWVDAKRLEWVQKFYIHGWYDLGHQERYERLISFKPLLLDIKNNLTFFLRKGVLHQHNRTKGRQIARDISNLPLYKDLVPGEKQALQVQLQRDKIGVGIVRVVSKLDNYPMSEFGEMVWTQIVITVSPTDEEGIIHVLGMSKKLENTLPSFTSFAESYNPIPHKGGFNLKYLSVNGGQSIVSVKKFVGQPEPKYQRSKWALQFDNLLFQVWRNYKGANEWKEIWKSINGLEYVANLPKPPGWDQRIMVDKRNHGRTYAIQKVIDRFEVLKTMLVFHRNDTMTMLSQSMIHMYTEETAFSVLKRVQILGFMNTVKGQTQKEKVAAIQSKSIGFMLLNHDFMKDIHERPYALHRPYLFRYKRLNRGALGLMSLASTFQAIEGRFYVDSNGRGAYVLLRGGKSKREFGSIWSD